ncbi:nucleoside/nucleotide kinase family protein [Streptomyces sp. NPDC057638]|uniref:nucleoside/nucleotide kinase family protein n=1 Tax=Streptomyces sp. NPDC057638 TaxID=3346190 RepID=UPI0036B0BD9C
MTSSEQDDRTDQDPAPTPPEQGVRTALFGSPSPAELAERALALRSSRRVLLGIVGEPGSGKSTLAAQVLDAVERLRPGVATAVSMDAFHLAQKVLDARGQGGVKGTIETFDGHGFLAQLRRTRDEGSGHSVWWPEFRREIEEPVAGAVEVAPHHRLVLVDGNFLLAPHDPWHLVRDTLTECWFLDADPEARRRRLTLRYIRYGFTPEAARAKAYGVDERTSALIRSTASRADLVLRENR